DARCRSPPRSWRTRGTSKLRRTTRRLPPSRTTTCRMAATCNRRRRHRQCAMPPT
ncbi:unnamed protein product, partial [Symbiodinium sp. KB8]